MTRQEVALAFIKAIDSRDFSRIEAVITPDHVFSINGQQFADRQSLRNVWAVWWDLVPDIKTRVVETIEAGDRDVLELEMSGTRVRVGDDEYDVDWRFPVAVIATISDDRVAQWREFCDPSVLHDIVRAILEGSWGQL